MEAAKQPGPSRLQRKPSGAEDEALFLDQHWPKMPALPRSVQERFPEMVAYQKEMTQYEQATHQRLRELAARRRLLPDALDSE